MADIGKTLKEKREARGLSFDDVYNEIKLEQSKLENVEKGQFDVFKNKVYARAFVREYANFLTLDPKPMLEEIDKYFDEKRAAEISEAPDTPEVSETVSDAPLPESNFYTNRIVLCFIVFAVLAAVCFCVSKINKKPDVQTPPAVQTVQQTEKPAEAKKYAAGVTVIIKTYKYYPKTLIRVVSDGTEKYNQYTVGGSTLEYTGQKYVKIYTDNSSHIQIRVNGRQENSMGDPNKPLTKFYQINTPETKPAE